MEFDDAMDSLLLLEASFIEQGRQQGHQHGQEQGYQDAKELVTYFSSQQKAKTIANPNPKSKILIILRNSNIRKKRASNEDTK